jgi:DNA-directed RNA polymerase beta' subunit
MNMHMPQDDESSAELRNLAAVPRQIISPANNSSIIGIFQDSLLGTYRITRNTIKFTPRQAMNILINFPKLNKEFFDKSPEKMYNSFEILSQILPPLTSRFKNSSYEDDENSKTSNNIVEIVNGVMKRGQLDKGVKKLIHMIFNDFGFSASADFIDNLQNIVTEYMKMSGFSVGISDLIADKETNDKIIDVITKKKNEVKNLINEVQIGVFENNTGKSNNEEFETIVNSILNKAQEEAGKVGRKSLSENNRFKIMVQAGSKGSDLNIAQMISCLGQQNVDGKRIPYGFEERTLPHFNKYDDSPEARGFVENSFIQGLNPQELFFHAMGGRVGLIDTAVKTSQTGYIQRRLIKGMEDLKVEYDMTVRNNYGKIVQFEYGDDGIDTTKVEEQKIPLLNMTIEEIYAHYQMPNDELQDSVYEINYTKGAISKMKKQKDDLSQKVSKYIDNILEKRELLLKYVFMGKFDTSVQIPVHFSRIITNVKNQLNIQINSMVDITPLDCFTIIEECKKQLNNIRSVKPTQLFELLFDYYMSPKELLMVHKFNKKGLLVLTSAIIANYKKALVSPGEMVGMIAAQSIGEPTTQLTLNSFVYETEILVRDTYKNIQKVQIGDFVNKLIDYGNENKTRMEYYPDKDTTYAPTLSDEYWEIQAPDEDGNVDWYKIEAGTRHPVINEDGTNTMLKVITEDEQEIIATKAKSFLMLKDGKLVATRGDELVVDNYIPVSTKIIDHQENHVLNLQEILPPTEYLYGSEAFKAMNYWNEYKWWRKYNNKQFILPYKRSDTFRDRMKEIRKGCNNRVEIKNGCVYPKKTWKNSCCLPDTIPLDYDFGFLIGSYCAEGCLTRTQISIANNDFDYHVPIQRWCDKYNITTKQYKHENKNKEGWTSSDIRIYSIVLTDLIEKLCGKLSHGKFIHQKLIFSNEEFKKGFINGYIGGDGSVRSSRNDICSYSVSYQLLSDFNIMLKTLCIYSYIRKRKLQTSNNRGTKPENICQGYTIYIRNSSMVKLAKYLENNEIKYKAENARKLVEYIPKSIHNRQNDFIPNNVNGVIVMEPRDNKMKDTVFVKIKSIEEVPNTTDYAYDLTVEKTRNFVMVNGLEVVDTFHFAGVSSKSNATRGVPRIEEILSLSKNPKNTSVAIYLPENNIDNKVKAEQMRHIIEHTSLRDIVKSVSICFDPDELNTLINHDKALLSQYKQFQEMVAECNEGENVDNNEYGNWVIRFEMDKEEMLDKNITMDDVHFAIINGYKDEISCVMSDYNADKLIFRVRLLETHMKKVEGKKTFLDGKQSILDQSDEIYMLKNVQENLLNNIILRGIKNINKVILRKEKNIMVKEEGILKRKDAWVLDTMGSNLVDILAIDEIDKNKTYTNDIVEIYDVLGIEAARQVIYNELYEVMDHGGTYINYHHMAMLCDRMCYSSNMISIFRHGINNDNIGPIAKASFEETPEMFLRAARHAEMDNLRGVSANVMTGQEGNYGTSAFQVVLDIKEMAKLGAKTFKVKKSIEEQFGIETSDDLCNINNINPLNNIKNLKPIIVTEDDEYNPGF